MSVMDSAKESDIQAEIIVVDDGSTDGTKAVCEEFGDAIKLIHHENAGVSRSRNRGLDAAGGEYVIFVDSDDTMEKNAFMIIGTILSKCDADLINFNYNVIRDGVCERIEMNTTDQVASNHEQMNEIMAEIDKAYIWNKVFKKSVMDAAHIRFCEDMSYGEDTVLLCEFLMKAGCVYASKEYTYNYTENAQSDSLSKQKYNGSLTRSFIRLSEIQGKISNMYPGYGAGYIDGDTRKIIMMKTIFNVYQADHTYKERKQEFMQIKSAGRVQNLRCGVYYGKSWKLLGTMYGKVPFILLDTMLRLIVKAG